MGELKISKYTQDILDYVSEGQGNVLVDAVAGSGKTHTLLKSIEVIPENQPILILAFNKSVVDHLKAKVFRHENVQVKTMHSMGMGALYSTGCVKVDNYKYNNIVSNEISIGKIKPRIPLNHSDWVEYKNNIVQLITLSRNKLAHSKEDILSLASWHGMYLIDNEPNIVFDVLKRRKVYSECIDFADMIYLPVVDNLPMKTYDWVFIDECQDLSVAQQKLALRCVKPESGRFIAVGDPKQAIYGFAGADTHSFNSFKNYANTKIFPLSVNYRCDKAILNLARSIVPTIKACNSAGVGEIDHKANKRDIEIGDVVLCAKNAPLASMYTYLTSKGLKAHIKGKDLPMQLLNIVKKTGSNKVKDMLSKLDKDLSRRAIKIGGIYSCSLNKAKEHKSYQNRLDIIETLRTLSLNMYRTAELIDRIQKIIDAKGNPDVLLSTIHKAKGLEFDRVFILDSKNLLEFALPNIGMSKITTLDERSKIRHVYVKQSTDTLDQYSNMAYVAFTRAKHFIGLL